MADRVERRSWASTAKTHLEGLGYQPRAWNLRNQQIEAVMVKGDDLFPVLLVHESQPAIDPQVVKSIGDLSFVDRVQPFDRPVPGSLMYVGGAISLSGTTASLEELTTVYQTDAAHLAGAYRVARARVLTSTG